MIDKVRDKVKVYFSFDKKTKELIHKLGYIPKDCYCSTKNVFIPEHVKKNREIVEREVIHPDRPLEKGES